MKNNTIIVRHSVDSDIRSITEIYAREVSTGLASFEVEPPDASEMAQRRRNIVQGGYPYLVATQKDKVIGYAYAGPYRTRPAYQHTLENSVYVSLDASVVKRSNATNESLSFGSRQGATRRQWP